jgi:hypothetical protein
MATIIRGARVVRKGTTRPEGTVERVYTSARNGKPTARVRWDSAIGGGGRIGGGTETHSAIACERLATAEAAS